MVCPACSVPVAAGVNFCTRCGAPAAYQRPAAYQAASPAGGQPAPVAGYYPPAYLPRPRVQSNLQTLGVMWCCYALYRVVATAIAMLVFKAVMLNSFGGPGWPLGHASGHGALPWLAPLLPVLAVVTVVSVALSAFTGWSLLQKKPWGRTLAIVAAILALLKFPLGTALGIYTLWVMAPSQSGVEWEAIADRS